MNKYKIGAYITEEYYKQYIVEALNEDEAMNIVHDQYAPEGRSLNEYSEDFIGTDDIFDVNILEEYEN